MLLHLVAGLYVSYDACEGGGGQGPGTQSLYVHLDDLTSYSLGMIVRSMGFLTHHQPASCSQTLLSTWQR